MKERNQPVFFSFSNDDFNRSRISLSLACNNGQKSDEAKENRIDFLVQIISHNFSVNTNTLAIDRVFHATY